MSRNVLRAQHVSRNCVVCGTENPAGLHARFLELEGDEVVCLFTPGEHHQGYPGRLHGGVASAILDETIGRAIQIAEPETWYVTVELSVRFRKPVPLGEELRAVGRVQLGGGRVFDGTGEILLADGTAAVTASARYMRLPAEKITTPGFVTTEWVADERPAPKSVEL